MKFNQTNRSYSLELNFGLWCFWEPQIHIHTFTSPVWLVFLQRHNRAAFIRSPMLAGDNTSCVWGELLSLPLALDSSPPHLRPDRGRLLIAAGGLFPNGFHFKGQRRTDRTLLHTHLHRQSSPLHVICRLLHRHAGTKPLSQCSPNVLDHKNMYKPWMKADPFNTATTAFPFRPAGGSSSPTAWTEF